MTNQAARDFEIGDAMKEIGLPKGFEATWAGPLSGRIFCFGSEDGQLLFTNEQGVIVYGPTNANSSHEAINGVAVAGFWLAISTRADITFVQMVANTDRERVAFEFPHGAHGMESTASGYFLAPLGRTGIMAVAPPLTIDMPITVHAADDGGFYNYRVGSLRGQNGMEIILTAGRDSGLGVGEFHGTETKHVLSTMTLEGLDVVDFCPLFPGTESLAVAVIGKDRRLLLFRDILADKNPLTFEFETIQGVAYRVLSCRGDVYVVTNRAIYMVAGLASAFMSAVAGQNIESQILVIDVPVIDVNLCGDEWMLALTLEKAFRFDVRALSKSKPGSSESGLQKRIREIRPAIASEGLQFGNIRQSRRELELAMVG